MEGEYDPYWDANTNVYLPEPSEADYANVTYVPSTSGHTAAPFTTSYNDYGGNDLAFGENWEHYQEPGEEVPGQPSHAVKSSATSKDETKGKTKVKSKGGDTRHKTKHPQSRADENKSKSRKGTCDGIDSVVEAFETTMLGEYTPGFREDASQQFREHIESMRDSQTSKDKHDKTRWSKGSHLTLGLADPTKVHKEIHVNTKFSFPACTGDIYLQETGSGRSLCMPCKVVWVANAGASTFTFGKPVPYSTASAGK